MSERAIAATVERTELTHVLRLKDPESEGLENDGREG